MFGRKKNISGKNGGGDDVMKGNAGGRNTTGWAKDKAGKIKVGESPKRRQPHRK